MSSAAHKLSGNYETRISLVEQAISTVKEGILRIERKLEGHDGKLDLKFCEIHKKLDDNFQILDKKIDTVHGRIWQLFLWGIGAFTGVLLIIAHGFKWF